MPYTSCRLCGKEAKVIEGGDFIHEDGSDICVLDGLAYIQREGIPGQPVCDFCSAPNVNWTLQTQSVTELDILMSKGDDVKSQTHTMSPDWAACDLCHDLIVKDDWEMVAKLAVASIESTLGRSLFPEVIEGVRALHQEVRALNGRWIANPGGVDKGR